MPRTFTKQLSLQNSSGVKDSSAGLKSAHSDGAFSPASTRSSSGKSQREGHKPSRSVCFYCKKKGHVMAECWKQEKKHVQPNSLAVPHLVQLTSGRGVVPSSPENPFNPFISKGSVSLSQDGE